MTTETQSTQPENKKEKTPVVAVVMGSQSDLPTMQHATRLLEQLDIPHCARIVSAHRTPDLLRQFAVDAASHGLQVIIAGAGGAAHLPGMIAAYTHLPVLGVPVRSKALSGMDSLLSIVQMPKGISVGSLAIGEAGAFNAAVLAAQILSLHNTQLRQKLLRLRAEQTQAVLAQTIPTPC